MPINISFKWTSSSQVRVHDSGCKSKKLSEINPCVHTVSAYVHPCPQKSHRTGGPRGVNPWQQARVSVLNSREKSSMVGECRKNSGRKPQKGFLEKVLQCLVCQRPDYTYVCFSLPAGMTMGNFISLLHGCQSHQMDCKLLEERAGCLPFVCFLSACLPMFLPTVLGEHEGRWNGTYRHHQRAFLHEKTMSWTGMGK